MQSEERVRRERLIMRERMERESDPLIRAVHKDRMQTLEWVIGD